jgi:hypothetical protein
MSIVAKFASFREKKKEEKQKVFMESIVSSAVTEIKEGTHFTTPTNGRGSGGISKTQFNATVRRVEVLEDTRISYIPLTATGTKTYIGDDFIFGINIIGVNAPGAVTIQLPQTLTTGTIVKIKDESLSAATNNITVETYLEV